MRRRTWAILLAAVMLLVVPAVTVVVRRARQAPEEEKGVSLDYAASLYGLLERLMGLPFRHLTIRLAGIKEGDRVLDIGCATGTLALLEKDKVGRSGHVAGIDVGPRLIAKAQMRAAKRGLEVDFRVASIDALPFPDDTFDVATSSLMVHHLPSEVKLEGFKEVHRALKPGGRYLIVDIATARGLMGQISLALDRLLSPVSREYSYSLDLTEGRVPQMLREAGFGEIEELGDYRLVGILPVAFIRARK